MQYVLLVLPAICTEILFISMILGNDKYSEPSFFLTYGDGVSDVNIRELLEYHQNKGKMMTISVYNIKQRFGILDIDEIGEVTTFREKEKDNGNLIVT